MKSPLNPEERALIRNIEAFNESVGNKGWRLQNRVLKSENLSRIELRDAQFDAVDLLNTDLSLSRLKNSRFHEVKFGASDFTHATISDCQFLNCDLASVLFAKAAISNCTFVDCKAEDLRMEGCVLSGCVFESLQDLAGAYEKLEFHDCRFEACNLKGSSFTWVQSSRLVFKDCDSDGVNFGEIKGGGIAFLGGAIKGSGLDTCTCEEIRFEKCNAKGLTLAKMVCGSVILSECERLESINILNSSLHRTAVESCKLVSEFGFLNSTVEELFIRESRVAYLSFRESALSRLGNLTGSMLAGCNFLKSRLFNLTVSSCAIEDYLVLTEAYFENLRLDNVSYGRKMDIDAKDVQYVNSSRFPGWNLQTPL